MHDSSLTIEEERMIEVALTEAAELFPNLNLLMMQSDDELNLTDIALQKARSNDDAVNAIDLLRMISKGADDNYAIAITSKKMYLNLQADLNIADAPHNIDVTDISSDNAMLYSIAESRTLELEDQMYLMQHYVCDYIGQLAYGLEQDCKDSKCMMQIIEPKSDLLRIARMEEHATGRLCDKCRMKFLERMPLGTRTAPSRLEII
jgi:hypothetical protein